MPLRSTFEIGTQIILLQIDGFLKGWILNITPLKDYTKPMSSSKLEIVKQGSGVLIFVVCVIKTGKVVIIRSVYTKPIKHNHHVKSKYTCVLLRTLKILRLK